MSSTYGWVITKDHLADDEERKNGETAEEVMGPGGIDPAIEKALGGEKDPAIHLHTFRMYDDDGILYYTGRAGWAADTELYNGAPHEDILVGPLRDFGTPNAGAVLIKWEGQPRWTCEWC